MRVVLINPQVIKPTAKNGKKISNGVLKIEPNISPILPIIKEVDIVIQKGPKVDLLYLCLISEDARYRASFIFFKEVKISFKPDLNI
ncbi:MAG: hypothetical protein ACLSE8_06825 [Parasutterella sp.]|jgi:hypothetical protein